MNQTVSDWEKLFAQHRGTELAILYIEAIRIGLRKGHVTAEDLHHIQVVNPNVRGAVMRGLRRSGLFIADGIGYGSTEQSHGHIIRVWRLADSLSARLILNKVCGMVDGETNQTTNKNKGKAEQLVFA